MARAAEWSERLLAWGDGGAARRLHRLLEWVAIALIAFAIVYQSFANPIVGLADNGDYLRIMERVGLDYVEQEYFDRWWYFVNLKYHIRAEGDPQIGRFNVDNSPYRPLNGQSYEIRNDEERSLGYDSSEVMLVRAAMALNRVLSKDGMFDLRVLAFVHGALYLLAIWALLVATRGLSLAARLLLAVGLVFAATDVGYVAYFNSLYSEPASLICLLFLLAAALGWARARPPRRLWPALYYAAALLLVISKPANSVLAPVVVALPLLLLRRPSWAARGAALAAGLAICLVAYQYYLGTPEPVRAANLYNMVFDSILKYSPSPEADLDALKLDRGLVQYRGTTAFSPASGVWVRGFMDRFTAQIGPGDVVRFYLTHPDRLGALIDLGAQKAWVTRVSYLGNFEKSVDLPPQIQSNAFAYWSKLRLGLPKSGPALVGTALALALALILGCWFARRRAVRAVGAVFGALLLMAAVQFGVSIVGDSGFELDRHLFLFNALVDTLLVFGAVWTVEAAVGLVRSALAAVVVSYADRSGREAPASPMEAV